jgi:hypothetical protein
VHQATLAAWKANQMTRFNPYDPPQLENGDALEGGSPPDPTHIIRWIPTAILGSILASYAMAFAVAMWTRPPPNARLLPLLFFAVPPLAVAGAMTIWAMVRYRRRQVWLAERRETRLR